MNIKKTLTFLLPLLLFFGIFACDDIEDNSPAFQAKVDSVLYRSNDARAEIDENGGLILQGLTEYEILSIRLSNNAEGVYQISGNSYNRATYQNSTGSIYTTHPFGHGEVEITQSNGSGITGNFKFTGYRFGLDTLVVSEGFFYKVPIISGSTEEEPEPEEFYFRSKVNGQNFVPDSVTVVDNGNQLEITGTAGNTNITLVLPNLISVGNYPFDNETYRAAYFDGLMTHPSNSGSVTITTHYTDTNNIAGTFSFICGDENNEFHITAGEFLLVY